MNSVLRAPRRFLGTFTTLLAVNLLVTTSHFSTSYVNSSFLSSFFSSEHLSLLYVANALIALLFLSQVAHVVRRIGVRELALSSTVLLGSAVFLLGISTERLSVVFFFITQAILLLTLRYLLDLYVESLSRGEEETGSTRSLFITAGNTGVLLAPLIGAVAVVGSLFTPVYVIATLLLIPALLIIAGPLRSLTPVVPPTETSVVRRIREIFCCRVELRRIMTAHGLAQLFFAGSIIYVPLYLFSEGVSWQIIGTISALSVLPYLVLEIPLGTLADRAWGEKEITLAGLFITGGSLVLMSTTPLSEFIVWTLWYLLANVGGALIEVGTESYFFKQVTESDADLIGAFRMLRPLGGLGAPLLAALTLPFVGLAGVFAVFGAALLLGLVPLKDLTDTR